MKHLIPIISIVIISVAAISLFLITRNPSESSQEECLAIEIINLKYKACYESNINSTILELTPKLSNYNIKNITIASDLNTVPITELPKINQTKKYIFNLMKTSNLKITVNSEDNCFTKNIKILPCDSQEISANFSVSTQESAENISTSESDIIIPELPKNKTFILSCKSSWQCSSWEDCIRGIQRRTCLDTNNCPIPNNMPDLTKLCSEVCKEKWQCIWTPCISGETHAQCTDLNKCNTNYTLPKKLSCKEIEDCAPSISCTDWEECRLDYSVISFSKGVSILQGLKSRYCYDNNNCILPTSESVSCSMEVDIYFKADEKCGEGKLNIYNKLDNSTLAKLDYSSNKINLKFFLSEQVKEDSC